MPASKRYEFIGSGRKKTKGKIHETRINLGGGRIGYSERVNVEIKKGNRTRKIALAEKILNTTGASIHYTRNIFILNELRKLKLSVPPTARLAVDKDRVAEKARQLTTDLSSNGKFKVVDYLRVSEIPTEVKHLINFKEIEAQIEREKKIAAQHGFQFRGREWLIVIDPKTNTGKPYIVDVKAMNLSSELRQKFVEWLIDEHEII